MVTTPHTGASDVDARGSRPSHVADLLRLITRDPGRPRLTWYGDDGERVELSGAVLENWVNKTTNLLVEEFDAGPGTRVVIDLPVHWRTVVWALAVWRVGATAELVEPTGPGDASTDGPDGSQRPDVVVTNRPAVWSGAGAELVAVALPALARRFDGDLPPGAIDAASAVMTYGDQVAWLPELDFRAPATVAGTSTVGHGDLLATPPGAQRSRELVDGREGVLHVLDRGLSLWQADGSVVLLAPSLAAALDMDTDRRARLLQSENAT
jgi:uncharacterized protein (TIGR03089 family)